ncbi:MAG: T9SS type A sorting domain-containing protein [Bacteroidota bacterium]
MRFLQNHTPKRLGIYLILFFTILIPQLLSAQATFESNVAPDAPNKNWKNPDNWSIISGSSALDYPIAGDTVIISGGDSIRVDSVHTCQKLQIKGGGTLLLDTLTSILTVTDSLAILESSFVRVNLGILTIFGSTDLSDGSLIFIDLGALTIAGALTADASLIDMEDLGALSIAGSMTTTNTNTTVGLGAITVAGALTLNASAVVLELGALTVTGNLSLNEFSTVEVELGALTVLGLCFLTTPLSDSGANLIDIQGGLFTCFGNISMLDFNPLFGSPVRFNEIRIGNSAVSIFGGLQSFSPHSTITFPGNGILTLAGVILIPRESFIANNGTTAYIDLGIPGLNQDVAALDYNNLLISGLSGGYKAINGDVRVADTLTLLSDTLIVEGGGSLTLADGATIVRNEGKLLSAPMFDGLVDIVYFNLFRDTTGLEMPSNPNVLRNLLINNVSDVVLNRDVTVNGTLTLELGTLFTNGQALRLTETDGGLVEDPAIQKGLGFVEGSLTRDIGPSLGIRSFPLGVDTTLDSRDLNIDFTTAPTVGGQITVSHFNTAAENQSGLPIPEGASNYTATAPMYWQVDASGGLSGGNYSLSLLGDGIEDVLFVEGLSIVKRPSGGGDWELDGSPGTNTGTNDAPIVVRQNMSGFSQFALVSDEMNPLPITLLDFQAEGVDNQIELTWTTIQELDNRGFEVQRSRDALDFVPIAFVDGRGNSSQLQNYTYLDNPGVGAWYYRLKQIDQDGSFSYSSIVYAEVISGASQGFLLYPNPLLKQSNVEYVLSAENFVNLSIYDSQGHLVKELVKGTQLAGKYQVSLEGDELAEGLYICRLQKGQDIEQIKFIIQ